jgi:hypothetical protein
LCPSKIGTRAGEVIRAASNGTSWSDNAAAAQQATDQLALAASGIEHYYRAGAKLTIGGVIFPRGSILAPTIVKLFTDERLHLMLRNRLLVLVLGPMPPPEDEKVVCEVLPEPDPDAAAKEREQMIAAMRRDGYQDFEIFPHVKPPPGAYTIAQPPAVERSGHDGSLASRRNVANTGS